ncbi:hypothetical protein TWF694_006648 [Orbilia ellipsospora]|uniref:Uncharacterized protein n=1 Tax=Orbilia ellipsospora TaxID=2528407 RepID=A0AAV9XL63_9PEZI
MDRKPGLLQMFVETTCGNEDCAATNVQKESGDQKEEEGEHREEQRGKDKNEQIKGDKKGDEKDEHNVDDTMEPSIYNSTNTFVAGPSTLYNEIDDWTDEDGSSDGDITAKKTSRAIYSSPRQKSPTRRSSNRLKLIAEIRNAPRKKPQQQPVKPRGRWSEPPKKKVPPSSIDDLNGPQGNLSDQGCSDEDLEYEDRRSGDEELAQQKRPEIIPKSILKINPKANQCHAVGEDSDDEAKTEPEFLERKMRIYENEEIDLVDEAASQSENLAEGHLNYANTVQKRGNIDTNILLANLLNTEEKGRIFQPDCATEYNIYQSSIFRTLSADEKVLEGALKNVSPEPLKPALKPTNYVYHRPGPVLRSHSAAAQKENLLTLEPCIGNITKRKAEYAEVTGSMEDLPIKRVRFAEGSKKMSTHKVLTKPPAQSMILRRRARHESAFGQKPDGSESESSCPDISTTKD